MIALLALRNVVHKPWRSALLFAGFGIGVAVMIVLLSVGEAMLTQARDEKLIGGGQVTVLPEGLDIELMKTGGVGGLWFSINNARFVHQQLLASPRLAAEVAAVAPQVVRKTVWLTIAGHEWPVLAVGEVPGATRAVGGAPALAAGAWDDDDGDRRWMRPTLAELRHDIDHFHVPPSDRPAADRHSWGEWHYFNVVSDDGTRWAFLSFMVSGDVPGGRGTGQQLFTLHEAGKPARRFGVTVPGASVRFSTTRADMGTEFGSVVVRDDGDYVVHGTARGEGADRGRLATVALVVHPAPHAWFPGVQLGGGSGGLVSGYAVPALRATATGTICVDGRCEAYRDAQSYHDHNWGFWRRVNWEWGAARAGAYTFLYGRVQQTDSAAARAPIFFYLVDSLGFRALFRPARVVYDDARTILIGGRTVRVPARAVMTDARGADTLRVELDIEDAVGTDTRRGFVQRGDASDAANVAQPYFIQMKGRARISGIVGGERIAGAGRGFFETYR